MKFSFMGPITDTLDFDEEKLCLRWRCV